MVSPLCLRFPASPCPFLALPEVAAAAANGLDRLLTRHARSLATPQGDLSYYFKVWQHDVAAPLSAVGDGVADGSADGAVAAAAGAGASAMVAISTLRPLSDDAELLVLAAADLLLRGADLELGCLWEE